MFKEFYRDIITLIKKDGTKIDNIKADVQTEKVFTDDVSVLFEEGDIILRTLPKGKSEYYEIINPEFHKGFYGIPDNYQIKVRKTTQRAKQSPIYVHATGSAKVNINSTDNSINNSFNDDSDIFNKLLQIAQQINNNEAIIKSIIDMRNAVNDKETFKEKYNDFIQSAAAHMTIFVPLISEITKLF